MRKPTLLMFLFTLCLMAGCSTPYQEAAQSLEHTQEENQEIVKSDIESIEISKYRSDSRKTQPELILFLSQSSDIEKVITWLNNIKQTSVSLPENISALYFIEVSYRKKEQLVKKRIAYAKDNNEQIFVKNLPSNANFSVEPYNNDALEQLKQKFQVSNWHIAERLTFIDNP